VVQVGLTMSSTTRAVVLASSVTATGAGIAGARFGFGAGDAEAVGAAVGAAVVGAAVVGGGVGDATPAGAVQPAARTRAIASPAMRMRSPLAEAGQLPLPHDRVEPCRAAF